MWTLKPIFLVICSWAFGITIGAADYYVFFFGISFLRFFVGFGIEKGYPSIKEDYVLNVGISFGKDLLF